MKRLAARLAGGFALCLLCFAPVTKAGAQTPDELAVKGAPLAQADPQAAELRKREPTDASRRGFDIGMAVAEGQSASGPGKDKFRDTLPVDERPGFGTAVAFSVERNRLAGLGRKLTDQFVDLAGRGAAIARQDPLVAVARALMESDFVYWLGFDVATGLFGDPALGGDGKIPPPGPGSLAIRALMSPAGQRGFDAAVALHASRNYKKL